MPYLSHTSKYSEHILQVSRYTQQHNNLLLSAPLVLKVMT